MNKCAVCISLLLPYLSSYSQSRLDFQAGLGTPTAYSTFTTPTYGVEYLSSVNKHVNIGITVHYEKYSFIYNSSPSPSHYGPNNEFISIEHNSEFLYVAPKFDLSIGKNKRPIHFFATLGVGGLLSGKQTMFSGYYANGYSMSSPTGRAYYWQISSNDLSDQISHFPVRIGSGFTEYVRLTDRWDISLTQEFGLITSILSSGSAYVSPDFKENYVSLQAGFAYKSHKKDKKVKPPKIFKKDYMED